MKPSSDSGMVKTKVLKPFFVLLLATFVMAITAPPSVRAASLAEIKKRGYMIVATEDDYAPFEFIEAGKPKGFHHDVVAELKKYAPFEIRQEILPWTGLLAAVSTGKYDTAITGSIVSQERLVVFNFVAPIAEATHYYIKRANDDRIKSVANLSGLAVGVQAGSVLLSRLPELGAMLAKTGGKLGKVTEYASYPEIYEDLANRRLDYAVNSIISAVALVKQRGDKFAMGQPVSGSGFHAWPVPKGNDDLLNYLTEFVAHLRTSGKLVELQQKWFGTTFPKLPTTTILSFEQYKKLAGLE
ncbi:MAG: transporter substrate-binding domain-containing protein [Rhodospirillales bacterium]|nr:transporter substrate-binding domain-containing protein [Rhodospirillales bacterium]